VYDARVALRRLAPLGKGVLPARKETGFVERGSWLYEATLKLAEQPSEPMEATL